MKIINTENAPKAIWPYSQAIIVWNTLYSSWQIGLNPKNMELVEWIENQTHQICKNLQAILKKSWLDLKNVVKTTIYLSNLDNFKIVNEIYWEYFFYKSKGSLVKV